MIPESNTRVTAELREIIDCGINIWDFAYPSYYTGDAKTAFEEKVTEHFYFRQIGAETVGRFLHYFRRTLREIMPYYIQRYQSVDMMNDDDIHPLDNYNMVENYEEESSDAGTETASREGSATSTGTGSTQGTGSSTTNSSGKDSTVHSDTPQGQLMLSLEPTDPSYAQLTYASDITQTAKRNTGGETSTANESSNSSESTSSEDSSSSSTSKTGTGSHTLTRRGNIGVTTYAQLLEGYRQTFLNIDMEIINELESCFLEVC